MSGSRPVGRGGGWSSISGGDERAPTLTVGRDRPGNATAPVPARLLDYGDLTSAPLPSLGRLSSVPPREVWKHEALSFTPWLRDNVDALNEVLGVDLELDAELGVVHEGYYEA